MRPLLLASTSPFRVALLRRLGLGFRATAPLFDETPPPFAAPRDCALLFAEGKARSSGEPLFSGLVIGADQTLEIDGAMLRKPGSLAESVEQLLLLAGRVHRLHTGVAVFGPGTGRLLSELTTIELTMRPLERGEAERYVALDNPSGSVGGYLFEKRGLALFEAVRGEDDSAIVGLPLIALCRLLRAFGVDLLGE